MKYFMALIIVSFLVSNNVNAQSSASFTLANPTAKSIPLKIPGVMNPNLSPFSKSGVDLRIGQKIYFKYKNKRRLLLEVTKENDGKTLNVAKLIKKRRKELDEKND